MLHQGAQRIATIDRQRSAAKPALLRTVSLLMLIVLLAGCGRPAEEVVDAGDFEPALSNQVPVHAEEAPGEEEHVHLEMNATTDQIEVVAVPSEVVVGPNRFAIGLFDAEGTMIHDADVHFHFVDLNDPATATPMGEADAERIQTADGLTTIYALERDFDVAGNWGVEVQARWAGGRTALKRIGFAVLAESDSISPGESVPVVDTLTLADVEGNLNLLTSAEAPNPALHEQSLPEALANNRPTLLLIATPAYCQTRFCGPAYELVDGLQPRYGADLNFVYVELFPELPNPAETGWQVAPAATAFGLHTEPWLYLIDAEGRVVYRVEGVFTTPEIERQLGLQFGL